MITSKIDRVSSSDPQADTEALTPALRVPADAAQLARPVRLRDGSMVFVRPLRADDMRRLQEFHRRLSTDTIVFRFFRVLPELSDQAAYELTHIDYENRMALAATTGEGADEQIRAVVRYDRMGPETAEVAFVVEDRWQGRGIATLLLHLLADYARARGFTTLVALTMASNVRMLSVLRHCGFPTQAHFESGDVEVRLDITQPPVLAGSSASTPPASC
jgi:GNAT superfamily N-acetyltransferase